MIKGKKRIRRIKTCPDCGSRVHDAYKYNRKRKYFCSNRLLKYCDTCEGIIETKDCNERRIKEQLVAFPINSKRFVSFWVREKMKRKE